ncbi:MAG: ATP-binding protein [Bacteroidales bacterium]|nr:ATP-binding protein [Bacteroidales bacterium]
MVERTLREKIRERLGSNKVIIIYGARQTGKTTLLRMIFGQGPELLWLNGDEPDVRAMFEDINSELLLSYTSGKKFIIIDEAQRIPDIGLNLKLISDNIPGLQAIVSGSSSFELASGISEPLTGRKWTFTLFPFSFSEMVSHTSQLQETRLINHRLIYGYYPDVVNSRGDEKQTLKELADSYLFRDLLMLDQIKKPDNILRLVRALAFQTGSLVSYNELGEACGLDPKTVEKYIDVLEKTWVIFRLAPFSRNLRNELKKMRKIYFRDNGIRNSIINDFRTPENRTDSGFLWENFIIAERLKYLSNNSILTNSWFWRTKSGQEIDLIEERDGKLFAYEIKQNPSASQKPPALFLKTYPDAEYKVITPNNANKFLTGL